MVAFVEGKDLDSSFWGQLCGRVCGSRNVSYRVQVARELPEGGEGKSKLIAFYRFARSRRQLTSSLNGKVSTLVFFLDKDVDEIRRRKCRSPHVIYTLNYDVQNYIFRHGDLFRSASAAASLDLQELSEHPSFAPGWCAKAARRWKDWIVLCLFAVKHAGGRPVNYRSVSPINRPLNGPVDMILHQNQLADTQSRSGIEDEQFSRLIGRLAHQVDRYFSTDTYDLVFKGKWYLTLLENDLRDAFPMRGQMQNVGTRTAAALLATLDFGGDWATHLRVSIVRVLDIRN
jgi:hypothetical protein